MFSLKKILFSTVSVFIVSYLIIDLADNANVNREELDRLLGIFFFGCNIPFVIVESVHFRNFVRALNPHYFPPDRKTLSTSNLDNRYKEFQQSIVDMQVNNAVLLIDGWKNTAANTQNVVAMLRLDSMTNRKYIFLNSWNFSTYRETGDALRDLVDECIGMARQVYNINIIAVITDNASNMIKMGTIVAIWHLTCNSHSGNLLGKSVVDEEYAGRVNKLLKNFKKPALEGLLLEHGGSRMVLIGQTRWCSHRNAYRRCWKNLDFMRLVADDERSANHLSEENRNFLLDPNLENHLIFHTLILDPVCELINTCQRADCTVAEATELWFRLDIPMIDEEITAKIESRRAKDINVFGLAANFLHPQYRGRRFADNQNYMDQVRTFFEENLTEEGLLELQDYIEGAGIFRILFANNYRSAVTFWKAASMRYPTLSELALKLHLLCASTAQLERLFSEWSYVHSSKRNRLTPRRSAKLTALYYDLRLNDQIMLNYVINDDEIDEYVDE